MSIGWIFLEYVSPSWSNPTPYSKILDISCNKRSQQKRMIKTGNNYSVATIIASTGQGEGTNVEANNTSGGSPVRNKSPLGILIFLVLGNLFV